MFKNYFIPHEGNDLRPRFFMWETVVIVFSLILTVELVFLIQIFWVLPRAEYSANILPGIVVNLTNQNRAEYRVPTLVSNEVLSRAAQLKANDMATKGYFSHTSPNGEAPWDFMSRAGYGFTNAGENLAVDFVNSEDVVSAWMRSETHKENILNNSFTEIGVGIARGVFEGREAVFVVQFFGRPISYAAPTPSKTIPPAPVAPAKQNPTSIVRPSANLPKGEPAITLPTPDASKAGTYQDAQALETQGNAPTTAKIAQSILPHSLSLAVLTEFFSQPHRMVNYLYIVMFTMIALAFSLMTFIKIRVQHPRLILNGAIMLLLLGSLIVFNQYLVLSQIRIL